ncbi:hypothetical protein L1887_41915 [Cichorium endivia]|nr:hypothetical protein L1887_41915 [Cichorium endivia]
MRRRVTVAFGLEATFVLAQMSSLGRCSVDGVYERSKTRTTYLTLVRHGVEQHGCNAQAVARGGIVQRRWQDRPGKELERGDVQPSRVLIRSRGTRCLKVQWGRGWGVEDRVGAADSTRLDSAKKRAVPVTSSRSHAASEAQTQKLASARACSREVSFEMSGNAALDTSTPNAPSLPPRLAVLTLVDSGQRITSAPTTTPVTPALAIVAALLFPRSTSLRLRFVTPFVRRATLDHRRTRPLLVPVAPNPTARCDHLASFVTPAHSTVQVQSASSYRSGFSSLRRL